MNPASSAFALSPEKAAIDAPFMNALSAKGFAVVGVNVPGTGCSSGSVYPPFSHAWAKDGAAAISWAAHLGWLQLGSTPLAFMGYAWTPWILTVLAVVELVVDQLPSTPSRTVPMQFGACKKSGTSTP